MKNKNNVGGTHEIRKSVAVPHDLQIHIPGNRNPIGEFCDMIRITLNDAVNDNNKMTEPVLE